MIVIISRFEYGCLLIILGGFWAHLGDSVTLPPDAAPMAVHAWAASKILLYLILALTFSISGIKQIWKWLRARWCDPLGDEQ